MIELYKSKLEILAGDEVLLKAIEYVFNKRIEDEKPTINQSDDNKLLGEKYRAYEEAKAMLARAVLDIQAYQKAIEDNKSFNKAR